MVRILVRIENLFLLAVGLILFHNFSNNWLLFIVFFLLPDISMVGYLVNNKLGSITYNLAHNYILVISLIALGMILNQDYFLIAGSILISHVGLDRFLGFGLKYTKGFKQTHIQKI